MKTLDLAAVRALMPSPDGVPRPDWTEIGRLVDTACECGRDESELSEEPAVPRAYDARAQLWTACARCWLEEMVVWASGSRVFESDTFLLLAGGRHAHLLEFAERSWRRLVAIFGSPPREWRRGKTPILAFDASRRLHRYLLDYTPDGEYGSCAGVFVSDGYPHIALAAEPVGAPTVLVHELTHLCFGDAETPAWVEEGVTQLAERELRVTPAREATPESLRECRGIWRRAGLERFWDGKGFWAADEMQEHAYLLAEVLATNLLQRHGARFARFVRAARVEDAGEAAARVYLGMSIAQCAAEFLGDGPWLARNP